MRPARIAACLVALWAVAACAPPGGARPAPSGADPAGGAPGSSLEPARRAELLRIMPAVATYLDDRVDEHGFPELVVGVVAGRELVWSRSYGSADEHTVFRIGSITKAFTGVAALILRDEGTLSLDDPAEDYLPELKKLRYPTTDSPRITVRHLLTHTSGIGMNTEVDYWSRPDHELSERELFDTLDGFELVHVPGTKTVYSNVGVGLVGLIVERAGGRRYRDVVTDRVLRPLGMTHTVWDREAVPETRLSIGSRRVDGMRVTEHHWRLGAIEGMGGLYSSLEDMARFAGWQLAAWPPRDGPDLGPLSRASVRESHMLAGHAAPDGRSYGIAWQVRLEPDLGHVVSHVGGTFQYAAAVWLLTDHDLGIVMLCNDGYAIDKIDAIAHNVARIIARGPER